MTKYFFTVVTFLSELKNFSNSKDIRPVLGGWIGNEERFLVFGPAYLILTLSVQPPCSLCLRGEEEKEPYHRDTKDTEVAPRESILGLRPARLILTLCATSVLSVSPW